MISRLCAPFLFSAIGVLAELKTRLVVPNCAWDMPHDARCDSADYAGPYPTCALFQRPDREAIPCQGSMPTDLCAFTGPHAGSPPPKPASYHLHVLFPNPGCTNCSADLSTEQPHFTYSGAMELRAKIAAKLNNLTEEILGRPSTSLIDVELAGSDTGYAQCETMFKIEEYHTANYHPEPCAFAVDDVMQMTPFIDPSTELGYPNFAFFLPGATWMPELHEKLLAWVTDLKSGIYSRYDFLLHPNTGCAARDHTEDRSASWFGKAYPLFPQALSCAAVGCNHECDWGEPGMQGPPSNCTRVSMSAMEPLV